MRATYPEQYCGGGYHGWCAQHGRGMLEQIDEGVVIILATLKHTERFQWASLQNITQRAK